jgi:hypothetical protein
MTKILKDLRPLHHFDPKELLVAAFRYYLGRRTIATCFFARNLAEAWIEIEETTRDLIAKELEEAFSRDDKDRAKRAVGQRVYSLTLGDDCDRAAWEEVRQQYTPRFKRKE